MLIRTIATLILSLLLATTAHADDEVEPFDFCRDISLIAKEVMKARQQDRPMSETLLIAINRFKNLAEENGREMDEEVAEKFGSELVMLAYKENISATDTYKQQKTTEFENAIFKDCYKETTSNSEE